MLTSFPPVSIIVPLGKHNELLDSLIASILSLEYADFEAILTEGRAGEAETALRQCSDARIRYVRGSGEYPASLRNLGVASAKYDLLAFLDSDCVPEPSWLRELVMAKEALCTRLVVGATQSATAEKSKWARVAAERYALWFEGARRGSSLTRVDTKNLMIEKGYLVSLGLFDVNLDSKEDRDLGLRILRSGEQIGYAPKAIVSHHDPETLRRLYRRAVWYAKGTMQFRAKYGVGMLSRNPDPIYQKRYVGESSWAALSIVWFVSVAVLGAIRLVRGPALAALLLADLAILAMAFQSLLRSFAKFLLGRSSREDFVFDLVTDLGHKVGCISNLFVSYRRAEERTAENRSSRRGRQRSR